MFVDEVLVKVKAGDGGDGSTAFRREKYIPMGGPFGGNGGKGADIIFKVDLGLHTLLDLRMQKFIKGIKGDNGRGKAQNGKGSEDVIIRVPQGTIVTDVSTGLVLADLKGKEDEVIVASGGRGGRGNMAFKTQNNTAPNFSENGEPGDEKTLKVELKMLADVGLVGMPSVGKSTLISKVSASHPKIADYHFTTLIPNLGVVRTIDGRSFVMADLPGLIEGAAQGEGLGDRFLKHIERTKVIAHIIDMASIEGRDPFEDYKIIEKELGDFNPKLLKKPSIIVANKMDMECAKANLEVFKSKVKDKQIFQISSINSEGLQELLLALADLVDKTEEEPIIEEDAFESHVLYKFKEESPYIITKEGDTWIISGEKLEKLFRMTKFNTEEGALGFARKLRKMGVDEKLEDLGAKVGDKIKIMDVYFDYKN